MADVLITKAAEHDYTESLSYYARRSADAAEGFELEFSEALAAIESHPDRYPMCDERHRYYLLRRYPFQIIYRQHADDRVLIVAVAHASRRPEYWKRK